MSWSYRKRGSVQRTHMKVNRKNSTFVRKQPMVRMLLSRVNGAALSHPVNGMSHPPKKSVAMSALDVTMLAYSAMKKSENFMAEYSVWYPATSSDTASGRTNGTRLVSANAETMKMKNAIGRLTTFHMLCACCRTISLRITFPARRITGIVDMPIATSYDT